LIIGVLSDLAALELILFALALFCGTQVALIILGYCTDDRAVAVIPISLFIGSTLLISEIFKKPKKM